MIEMLTDATRMAGCRVYPPSDSRDEAYAITMAHVRGVVTVHPDDITPESVTVYAYATNAVPRNASQVDAAFSDCDGNSIDPVAVVVRHVSGGNTNGALMSAIGQAFGRL